MGVSMKRYLLAAVSLFTACQPLALNSGVGGSSTPEATPLPSALSSASPTFLPTPQTTPSPQLSATPSPVVSPSALPSIAPVPVASVSVPAVIIPDIPVPSGLSGFDMLGLGYFYEFGLEPGQQRRIALPTQPGETYTFSIEGYLRYFGDNPQTPLFSNAQSGISNQTFVATGPFTYFVLEGHERQKSSVLVRKGHYLSFPTPLPDVYDDSNRISLHGKVFDDTQSPMEGVNIEVKSLNTSHPFSGITTTAGGTYVINSAPAGIQLEIIASKPGFTTRRRVETLKSNKAGDPYANRHDFGINPNGTGNGSAENAISDRPEVVSVSFPQQPNELFPQQSFVLTFSEPMDTKTVENSFSLRAYQRKNLSVDTNNPRGLDADTFVGSASLDFSSLAGIDGTAIYDKNVFDIRWNRELTQAAFRFKAQYQLPTDQEISKVPVYLLTFQSLDAKTQGFKDKSGITRSTGFFKLSEGPFASFVKLSPVPDTQAPQFTGLDWAGSPTRPELTLSFSEAMRLPTLGRLVAGGMNGQAEQAAMALEPYAISAQGAAHNYLLTLSRNQVLLVNQRPCSELGGSAQAGAGLHQVQLSFGASSSLPTLQSGDQITLQLAPTVLDPAGNAIDPAARQQTLVVP